MNIDIDIYPENYAIVIEKVNCPDCTTEQYPTTQQLGNCIETLIKRYHEEFESMVREEMEASNEIASDNYSGFSIDRD